VLDTFVDRLWVPKGGKMRLTFKELKDEIAKIVPKSIDYTVGLEAGNIAIVTPVPEKFVVAMG